jgi:hypothetical protein
MFSIDSLLGGRDRRPCRVFVVGYVQNRRVRTLLQENEKIDKIMFDK